MKQQLLLVINSLPEKEREQLVDELLQVIDAYFEQARRREKERPSKPSSEPYSTN